MVAFATVHTDTILGLYSFWYALANPERQKADKFMGVWGRSPPLGFIGKALDRGRSPP